MNKLKVLLVIPLLIAGCATGNTGSSGMTSSSRVVRPAKQTPAKVSLGGENRVRTNVFTRPR